MDVATLIREFKALPVAQKREVFDAIRDDLGEEPAAFEPPAHHREVLAERTRLRDADPTRGESWDVVRRRLGWDS
jgi:hypothetical protein